MRDDYVQSRVHVLATTTRNEETFLQDFIEFVTSKCLDILKKNVSSILHAY